MVKVYKGFTLIEIMIVVAIVAILAAISYPGYQNYVQRTKRVEAQSTLQEISYKLSAYKITHGTFENVDIKKIYGVLIPNQGVANYNLTMTDEDDKAYASSAKRHTWKLIAEPKNSMNSTGNLTLDSSGKQCWYKEPNICLPWDGR